MPPLIAAVLLGAGAYAGFRAVQHIVTALGGLQDTASAESSPTVLEKDLGCLEQDPATGIYRPSTRK